MTKPIARDPIYRRRRFEAEIIELFSSISGPASGAPSIREESARYAEPIPRRELLLTKLEQAGRPLA